MSRPAYVRPAQTWSIFLPLTACLIGAAACNNTCFSVALNSPGSTVNVKISNPPPSCSLTTANGIVHVEIGVASGPTSTPGTVGPRIVHLFVTLTGADAHPSPVASDDAPGWQPLALQLQVHPLRIDLLAGPEVNASSALFPDAVVPSGVYRQFRLRLATLLPDDPLLQASPCGGGMPHCAVLSDGRIQALFFSPSRLTSPGAASSLRILFESLPIESNSETGSLPGHELVVMPDGLVTLRIDFDPDRSWVRSSGDSLFLAPVFHLRVRQHPRAN